MGGTGASSAAHQPYEPAEGKRLQEDGHDEGEIYEPGRPAASTPHSSLPTKNTNTVGAASRNSQTPANEASSCGTNSVSTATNTAAASTTPR